MRVVCLQPTRDPVLCGDGPIRIGSAANDEVVVDGAGAAPHHVSIVADARGLVLTVAPGCRRVHVNARAVRERALLRYGDTITLGDNRLLLTSDESPARRVVPRSDAARESSEPVLLRIVAGRDSGLALSVSPQLHLGAGHGILVSCVSAARWS